MMHTLKQRPLKSLTLQVDQDMKRGNSLSKSYTTAVIVKTMLTHTVHIKRSINLNVSFV